jgi:hypothetical protein
MTNNTSWLHSRTIFNNYITSIFHWNVTILLVMKWSHDYKRDISHPIECILLKFHWESVDLSTFSMKRCASCWKCSSINALIPQRYFKRSVSVRHVEWRILSWHLHGHAIKLVTCFDLQFWRSTRPMTSFCRVYLLLKQQWKCKIICHFVINGEHLYVFSR